MTHLITKTKVLAPRRQHNLLRRPHLLEHLESMVGARLALIVAPAGYGKTSTLIDWADATSRVACWYTVDILDEDATRFVAHWFAAIQQQFPRFGLESNAILQAYAEQQATLDQVIIKVNPRLCRGDTESLTYPQACRISEL
jgi:LuxR family transcriptional regulator, maltose regulon positive regulatory protein